MEKDTHTTKEEAIIKDLDDGGALSPALARHGGDHADTQLYSALYSLKDEAIDIPSRSAFQSLLGRVHGVQAEPVASPYVVASPFAKIRFAMPIVLGLLIVVSGVGLETGRITFEESGVPQVSFRVAEEQPLPYTATTDFEKIALTQKSAPVAFSTASTSVDAVQEEDYDAYFEEENQAFTNIANAYEVTI